MLECLCVISLIAAMVVLAVSYYRAKQKTQTLALVRSDVKRLSYALRTYVYSVGCYTQQSEQAGYFAGDREPAISELQALTTNLPTERQPLIQSYAVMIDDLENTDPKNGPRVYHRLWVKATLNANYADRSSVMASLLSAKLDSEQSDVLMWSVNMIDSKHVNQSKAVLGFVDQVSQWNSDDDQRDHSLAACWLKEAA